MRSSVRTEKKKIRGNWIVPLFLVILLSITLIPFHFRIALVISDYREGGTLCVLPLTKNERFSIRYKHSVNLSDVTDTLEWTGTELILRDSIFTSFGAGIPVPADGIGTDIVNTENGFLLSGIDKQQKDDSLLIMLQEVPNHRLLYRNHEVSLLEMAGSGALLMLKVRPVSLLEMLLYRY